MSDKSVLINELQTKEQNYSALLEQLSGIAKEHYGETIMYDYTIPHNFNLEQLNENEIVARTEQAIAVPYNNRIFKELLSIPKKVVKNIFIKSNKGKNVQGMFLIGKNQRGGHALFALTIVRDIKNPQDYSIKLDVKPQNKFWLPLARIDCSEGMSHPNYIINGKVVNSNEEIVRVPTPHIHINNQLTQVLFSDSLEYCLAKPLQHVVNKKTPYQTESTFMNLVNYMLKLANIKVRIMENLNHNQIGNTLFNFEDVYCVNTPKELGV